MSEFAIVEEAERPAHSYRLEPLQMVAKLLMVTGSLEKLPL